MESQLRSCSQSPTTRWQPQVACGRSSCVELRHAACSVCSIVTFFGAHAALAGAQTRTLTITLSRASKSAHTRTHAYIPRDNPSHTHLLSESEPALWWSPSPWVTVQSVAVGCGCEGGGSMPRGVWQGLTLGREAPVSYRCTSHASLRHRWHTADGCMSCRAHTETGGQGFRVGAIIRVACIRAQA